MFDYFVSTVDKSDSYTLKKVEELLAREGIKKDRNLEHICAVFDSNLNVIATGSAFGNTLRCFAVSSEHRGENLLSLIMGHLLEWEFLRGNDHVFLYTKPDSAKFFKNLGFYEIAQVDYSLVFMENKRNGFSSYLGKLSKLRFDQGVSSCIVMNANPFTKGHRYLIEHACSVCDHLHLFVVSEDSSLVPYTTRLKLIEEGTADLNNIKIHESGSYIISNATFPSYFLKDDEEAMKIHAKLDVQLFKSIAKTLDIKVRFVGMEPSSVVTGIYNQVLCEELSKSAIELDIVPRLEIDGIAVSASSVRKAIFENDYDTVKRLVPETTYKYLISKEADPLNEKIKRSPESIQH